MSERHKLDRDDVETTKPREKISRRNLILGGLASGVAVIGVALDVSRHKPRSTSQSSTHPSEAVSTPEAGDSTPEPTEEVK